MKFRLVTFLMLLCTASQLYAEQAALRIVVTRTTYSTLLMEELLKGFRQKYPGVEAEVTAFGSLRAMDETRKGNADILITYYPPEELRLLKEGVVSNRIEFMHSTYVILGPPGDELGLLQEQNVQGVLRTMAESEVAFVTSSPRGGTFQKINDLWASIGIKPDWPWYEIADTTPLGSMRLAAEQNAYTIADLGSYILHQQELSDALVPLSQGDFALRKPFSVMQVNAEQLGQEPHPLAQTFEEFIVSDEGQEILLDINRDIFKAQVLFPAAHFDPVVVAMRANEQLAEKNRYLNIVSGLFVLLVVMMLVAAYTFFRANRYHKEQLNAEIARVAAEKANEEKSKFLSRMSHELRTPMNAVLGFTQLLLLEEKNAGKKDFLEEIHAAGIHLQHLIDDVLDVSRLERDEINFSFTGVDIGKVIQECISLSSSYIRDKHLQVKVEGDIHYKAHADATRLKEVLVNLISNAAKYNIDNGSITVNVEKIRASDYIRISVSDTGVGLSEEQQRQLFMPFERLGAENSTVEGTGIGLVITKKFVEKMYGVMGFESEKGKGSTFWVEFSMDEQA